MLPYDDVRHGIVSSPLLGSELDVLPFDCPGDISQDRVKNEWFLPNTFPTPLSIYVSGRAGPSG